MLIIVIIYSLLILSSVILESHIYVYLGKKLLSIKKEGSSFNKISGTFWEAHA